jgi:hypothetical protein
VSDPLPATEWRFVHFGLLVTGKGEEEFLPDFFRSLTHTGQCTFEVIRRVPQLSPITSEKRRFKMTGQGKTLEPRDEEIGLTARAYLMRRKEAFVILVDDLEGNRALQRKAVYDRYRLSFDTILGPQKHRASVHFLTNMLEAYYFADARALNKVLGTSLNDHEQDVETIPHPKGLLKEAFRGFDQIEHGGPIVAELDLPHILSRPETCASLRTLFAWCLRAIGVPFSDQFQLIQGTLDPVTRQQIEALP